MNRAILQWNQELESPAAQDNTDRLHKQLGRAYTIYGSLLLLATSLLDSAVWQEVVNHDTSSCDTLLRCIAQHMKVTHIAVTRPIPPLNNIDESTNIVRSPSNFVPLHGDFGPVTCQDVPTREDFESAYWTTAKQNGISQTWAPRWTMFSRGNISEKARILELPSVREAVEDGRLEDGCSAVDLYAGIGYFTFSYLKAGVSKVLCWDINPWSIEGLLRGAASNKWLATTFQKHRSERDMAASDVRLLVFNESNDHAGDRVSKMRDELPPIRHVNCGLLPTSRGSWETALTVLDPVRGGWIHVHENVAQGEIEQKGEEVRQAFQQKLTVARGAASRVNLEHINRVKTYAPGVYHVVLDIYVPPRSDR